MWAKGFRSVLNLIHDVFVLNRFKKYCFYLIADRYCSSGREIWGSPYTDSGKN